MTEQTPAEEGLRPRLVSELKRYAVVSLYLFVCFAVVLVYEASQSPATQATPLGLGVALGKALVMGKFILIGEALKPGTRIGTPTLAGRVALRSVGMLIVLVVLKLIEETIIGLVHGQSVAAIFAELAGRSWLSLLGPILLMLLILIPLMIAIELARALGDAQFKALLIGRQGQ